MQCLTRVLKSILHYSVTLSMTKYHQCHCQRLFHKEVNFVPYQSVRPVYIVPASKSVQIPHLFRTEKNTDRTGEVRLFRPINAYQTETRKRRKRKKKHSHSLISHLSTHRRSQFLKLIAHDLSSLKFQIDLLNRRSPSLFQIYFLFPLSWLRPMYAK